MKYCLKCAKIVSDNSRFKDRVQCSDCHTVFEEDEMTGSMFESLSEVEKEQYAKQLFAKIGNAVVESRIRKYGEPNIYRSWWYDKYEKMRPGSMPFRYMTKEEEKAWDEEHYGPDSEDYQNQLLENLLEKKERSEENQTSQVQCPYCGSSNVNKMRDMDKIIYGGKIGLLASLFGKQWYCKNCNSKF